MYKKLENADIIHSIIVGKISILYAMYSIFPEL